jgi:hypothetical protein
MDVPAVVVSASGGSRRACGAPRLVADLGAPQVHGPLQHGIHTRRQLLELRTATHRYTHRIRHTQTGSRQAVSIRMFQVRDGAPPHRHAGKQGRQAEAGKRLRLVASSYY